MRASRYGRGAGDDSGVALLTVIGVMVVMTILAVGAFTLSRQALYESERVEDESRAFRAASSGLDLVLTTFDPDSTDFPIVGTTPDGSYVVDVAPIGYGEYKLTSVGTGLDGKTESVTQRFFYMNLWEMNFAGTGSQTLISGSGGLNGSSNIIGPFYMKGNLSIGSNMTVHEGPLFVKNGRITVASSGSLGLDSLYIKVYCTGDVPPNVDKGDAGGVFVSSISRSVPDINLPDLTEDDILQLSAKAQSESVDNIMGSVDRTPVRANLEATAGNAATYTTMAPPNSGWTRAKAWTANPAYKYIGAADGVPSGIGEGATPLVVGGSSFGSWGSVVTTDGVSIAGDGHYTLANSWDDLAYDDASNILYINGTVFVDGPLTFTEDTRYVGNGTIIANGDITIGGYLRPYGTNAQAENNKWALGLVTPTDLSVQSPSDNSYDKLNARNETPTLAGAFFASGIVHFYNNVLMRGSVLAGRIDSDHPNMTIVTNPLLPKYLPDSLPGAGQGLLWPGMWTRG